MPHDTRPKLVGLNHIALEVGSVEEALAFYGAIFTFTLRGRGDGAAFIDMGDQFLALMEAPVRQPAGKRHFGLVVEDRAAVQQLAEAAGATLLEHNNFLDPWGNRIEVVAYNEIQFTKAEAVLRGMGLALDKSAKALDELRNKGMAPGGP